MFKINSSLKKNIQDIKALKQDIKEKYARDIVYKASFNFLGKYVIPFVPFEVGDLRRSTKTNKKGDRIFYSSNTDYAKRLYYNDFNFKEPGTGKLWFVVAFEKNGDKFKESIQKLTDNLIKKHL